MTVKDLKKELAKIEDENLPVIMSHAYKSKTDYIGIRIVVIATIDGFEAVLIG